MTIDEVCGFVIEQNWSKELKDKVLYFLGSVACSDLGITQRFVELINCAREDAVIAACEACDRIDPDNPPDMRDESRD